MKSILCFYLILVYSTLFSQTNVYFGQKDLVFPQKGGFYQTEDDLLKDSLMNAGVFNKAFDKLRIAGQKYQHRDEINFDDKYYKMKHITYFGYKDYFGNRHRIIKGKDYVVLCAGAKWLYATDYGNNLAGHKPGKNRIEKYGYYKFTRLFYGIGVGQNIWLGS